MKEYPPGKESGAGHKETDPDGGHDQTFEHLGLSREQIAIVLAAVFCGTPSAQAQQTNPQDCEGLLTKMGLDNDFSLKLTEGKCDDGKGAIEIRDSDNNIVMSYTGGFREGLPDGYGIVDLLDGTMTYAGELREGKGEGLGETTAFNDSGEYIEFMGEFEDGEPSGYGGQFIYEQGPPSRTGGIPDIAPTVVWFGEFQGKQLDLNGVGIELQEGCMWYGEFKDGVTNGWGAMQCPDFLHFGEFKDGLPNGRGTTASSKQITIGSFKGLELNGTGEVFEEGYHFRGEFRSNMANGEGKLTLPYGDTLEGEWIDGHISPGCIREPKGKWTLLVGDCSNGVANGEGVAKKDGEPYDEFYRGELKDGVFQDKTRISAHEIDPGMIETIVTGEEGKTNSGPRNERWVQREIGNKTKAPSTTWRSPTALDNFGKGGGFHTPSGFPQLPPFALPNQTSGETSVSVFVEEKGVKKSSQPKKSRGVTKQLVREKKPEKWGDGATHEAHIVTASDYLYVGEFLYGRKDGLGISIVTTNDQLGIGEGNTYIGEWRNGGMNGMGILYDTNNGKPNALFGERKEGEIVGKGVRFWLDPSSSGLSTLFVGDFSDKAEEHECVYFNFANGTTYVGPIKDEAADGRGASFFPNGDHVHEQRENGEFNGEHVVIIKDGGILTGVWHRNILDENTLSFQFKDYEPETLDTVYNAAEGFRSKGSIGLASVLYKALLSTALAAKAQERLQELTP